MEFLVPVKVVPSVDALRFDPVSRTVVREGVELFLNPFDQRALRVAIELRRSGERVRVVSLGPPGARPLLREALVHGADSATLLSDPAFRGSDTLATARVLASVVDRTSPTVVVTGAWTTDSETGQVPAELAALLGWPSVTDARAIVREVDGPGFEVTVDTGDGWATVVATPPFVLSVGEKIAKPFRATPEALAAVPEAAVGVLSLGDLGLRPESVGAAGSPTVVESVADASPERRPVLFSEGTVEERVAGAMSALAARLHAPRAPVAELPAPPSERDASREVLVSVTDRDGRLAVDSLSLVSEVRRALPGYWPSAVAVGEAPTEADTYRLGAAGALAGYFVPTVGGAPDAGSAALAWSRILDDRSRAAGAMWLADPFGRTVAGRVAATHGLGLTGDAVAVTVDARGLLWTKPSFGGRTLARIRSRTRPSLATVRSGAFDTARDPSGAVGFAWDERPSVARAMNFEERARGVELASASVLDRADVVVATGMGVGGPDGVARVARIAERWRAAVGGTRRVVDAGWLPRQLQIGLTGRAPAPRLGVLLGVSGSANHLVGWRRAGLLLAVNRDPGAPVFREVDVGIVGELDDVLPRLEEPLAAVLRPP